MRIALVGLVVLIAASSAAALDITACNQGVPANQIGVLQTDLDCSGQPASTDGVWIEGSGTLDLNGHTIIGPPYAQQPNGQIRAAVHCRLGRVCDINESGIQCFPGHGHCTVTSTAGTGHVTGLTGVVSERDLLISHVSVAQGYVVAGSGRLTATDVTLSQGSLVGSKIFVNHVSVDGASEFGVFADRQVRGMDLTVTNNGFAGVRAGKVVLGGLVATGNGVGPSSQFLGGGVNGRSVRLLNSTLTGNVANFPVGSQTFAADLFTTRHPRLVATSCDHSAVLTGDLPPGTWGVCALD